MTKNSEEFIYTAVEVGRYFSARYSPISEKEILSFKVPRFCPLALR